MSQKKAQLFNPLNGNINVTGVVTAASFVGSGSGLTGVASTDNITTGTAATFTNNVNVSGIVTASGGFKGDLTGDVTGDVSSTFITGVAATFTGNVTIGGTLTYQDVSHIDAVGIITAQQGIQVLANGLDITGVSSFSSNAIFDGSSTLINGSNKLNFNTNTGQEGQLYATSEYFYINSSASTGMFIQGNGFVNIRSDGGEDMFKGIENGAVELYYDNSKKLETTNTGVTVTGTLAATAVTSDDYTGNLELDVFLFG